MNANDRMARAEDYVFGLMDERERERAERDMEVDAEFRECVMVLADRLRRLHRAKGAAPMSDTDWDAITQGIAGLPQMGGVDASVRMSGPRFSGMAFASPDTDRKGMLGIKRPGAQQLGGWRGIVVAAALAAALALGYAAGQGTVVASGPVAVAMLQDDAGMPGMLVETFEDGALRILPLAEIGLSDGEMVRLWTQRDGEAMPLATLSTVEETVVQAPRIDGSASGRFFQLTVETAADGPAPEGRVLFSGEAVSAPG
ncbi:hypothetical protein [Mesorhizobium sp. CAU 1741]|uniref:hypothetical protein n=1 Tax=Mesorhizobium sp. CAU 1741 TaxID=3140366 RepID=UPI00325B63E2